MQFERLPEQTETTAENQLYQLTSRIKRKRLNTDVYNGITTYCVEANVGCV